jgi:hypothetical protein
MIFISPFATNSAFIITLDNLPLPSENGCTSATINLIKCLADKGHKIIIIAPKIGGKELITIRIIIVGGSR